VIVLDTNVLSELTRHAPHPAVLAWLNAQPAHEVCTTAITAAELLYGVDRLPAGRRKNDLLVAVEGMLHVDLAGRVEPFDLQAATEYATLVTEREALGRPVSIPDAQIAAVCRAHSHALATRNVKDFTDTQVELINPWDA
jgi:predicted nucleic acid-binding protein